MANKRGRVHRSSRARGMNVWTTVLFSDVTVGTGAIFQTDIVADSDWVPAAGTARATLKRVRGWYTCIVKDASLAKSQFVAFSYIGLFDEDESAPAASTVSTYSDEDVLWTGLWRSPGQAGTAIEAPPGITFEINIKAQRKMRADDSISFF